MMQAPINTGGNRAGPEKRKWNQLATVKSFHCLPDEAASKFPMCT